MVVLRLRIVLLLVVAGGVAVVGVGAAIHDMARATVVVVAS